MNERTLKSRHPIYRKRCERDGLELDRVWMIEENLDPDRGEPVQIEQPTRIIAKPLSMDDQDDRIRSALGLTSDDPLPDADNESLVAYYNYVAAQTTYQVHSRIEVLPCERRQSDDQHVSGVEL